MNPPFQRNEELACVISNWLLFILPIDFYGGTTTFFVVLEQAIIRVNCEINGHTSVLHIIPFYCLRVRFENSSHARGVLRMNLMLIGGETLHELVSKLDYFSYC